MEIVIIILSVLVVIASFIIRNFIIKVRKYAIASEEMAKEINTYKGYLVSLSVIIEKSDKRLSDIDKKGAYSSDDELGWFFNQIKFIQTQLDKFIIKK